jgi:hypothetical protein
MPVIRAYVYKVSNPLEPYKVYPPVVVLHDGDTFELVNTLDKKISWTVHGDPFTQDIDGEPIAKKDKSTEKKPKAQKGQPAVAVEYEVNVGLHKAHGNSDPVIIIDP